MRLSRVPYTLCMAGSKGYASCMSNKPDDDDALFRRLGEIRDACERLDAEREEIIQTLSDRGHSRSQVAKAAGYKSANSVQRRIARARTMR
jgi:hypothetical protein